MGKDDYKRRANIFQLFFSSPDTTSSSSSSSSPSFLFAPIFLANPLTMLFSASFVTLIALSGVVATPAQPTSADVIVDFNLSIDTKYNAPIPPWEKDSHPGWYYGNGQPAVQSNNYPSLTSGGVRIFGLILWLTTRAYSFFFSPFYLEKLRVLERSPRPTPVSSPELPGWIHADLQWPYWRYSGQ